jgi:hypothetical protein
LLTIISSVLADRDLTTFEIAKIAEDRLKGKLIYNTEVNNTANNMWSSLKLIDEIQDLKSIIKNLSNLCIN